MSLSQAASRAPATASRPRLRVAGRIKDSSVADVKAAASIVDVVSARTQLRKTGAGYMGRCPFHDERTPSFSVSPAKGTYHCFGCGVGGDTIRFVQETEQVDFVGAIEWLADRFNVALEYEEISPEQNARRRRRDRLLELLDAAASFYERYLWDSPAGSLARDHLTGRGLREEVCREYRLGVALGDQTLARKALAKGFTTAELAAAGLVNRRGNDYFSQRLLFPLADARGRVLGFQARKLREDDPLRAKYVNSPESELFRKGDLLYGLDRARAAIAREDRALVVEGNTDVLALRQVGLEPTVASMGTALTEWQLKELARLTKRIWLCFDGDAAGEAATLRGMELAAAQGFDVRVVALPAGIDPADAADGFEGRVADAESYLGYRVRLELERAPDRQEAFVRVREVLSRFEDSPERQEALRLAADRLDLPRETQAGLAPRATASTGALSPRVLEAGDRLERDALAGVLAHPSLVEVLAELAPDHFDSALNRRLRDHLVEAGNEDDELVAALAELHARAAVEGIDEHTAEQALLRLRERRLRRDLAEAEGERLLDLQHALAKVRTAFHELA
ncbi:MAG TPA: DNA primase [Gaiellaceae bacterium]|jgi:DNA primase|nr:DNA primase [Gaiellaceae bacterium]